MLTESEARELDGILSQLRSAGAGQQQLDNETRNFHEMLKWRNGPRSSKALPSSGFITSKGRNSVKEVWAYWSLPVAEREKLDAETAKEAGLTIADVRKMLSESHPDHHGSSEAFIAAKKKLDDMRKRK